MARSPFRLVVLFVCCFVTVLIAQNQTAAPQAAPSSQDNPAAQTTPAGSASSAGTQSPSGQDTSAPPQTAAPASGAPPAGSSPSQPAQSQPDANPPQATPAPSTPPAAQPVPPSQPSATTAQQAAASFDQVIDRAVEREHFFMAQMRQLHPLVETYLQNLREDKDINAPVPTSDIYFLGRLDMTEGTDDRAFVSPTTSGLGKRMLGKFSNIYAMKFLPLGFAQMVVLDEDFQRKFYDFNFVRREFLGEVRCIVVDVNPKKDAGKGRFLGRIWIEDQDYNIVRFNGTYYPHPRSSYYLHFDSWRLNMRPGVWLPAYVYSEESDLKYRLGQTLHYKAQTRLWGYNLKDLRRSSEFTDIQVESAQSVQDQSRAGQDASPIEAKRAWEHQAELNVLDRLQQIGLLAPEGPVDKVLQTVVDNVMVTNNLEIQPDVRCRVLLTTPLESFTIGHTIVMSRGMIDVLPDEASLAMVLTHELAHIVLGHQLDTKLAFNDRMFFPDERTFERMDFARDRSEEDAADKKAVELLNKSPYKDKLGSAGLFLKAVQLRSPELRNLIRPHLGDSLLNGTATLMSPVMTGAPSLDTNKVDQVSALPLGGRIKVDAWSNQVELIKTKPVSLTSAAEKMPFEVTPFYPFLTRFGSPGEKMPASTPSGQ
jgi:hypothetical protein